MMNPKWMDWIENNMPTHLRNDMWQYFLARVRAREDEIYRLRESINEAVWASEDRMELLEDFEEDENEQ